MNLPLLTAKIGKAWPDKDVFSVKYENPKLDQEKDKRYYVVFMIFDLRKNEISFENIQPYNGDAIRRYKYFGNNGRSAKQFHVVREGQYFSYYMGLWKNLKTLLDSNGLKTLSEELSKLEQVGLINCDNGYLSIEKMTYVLQNPGLELNYDEQKKKFKYKDNGTDRNISEEELIRKAVGGTNKDKFVLIVPQIRERDGSVSTISNHSDYLELIKRIHKLGESSGQNETVKDSVNRREACYICSLKKNDLRCKEYSTKFRGNAINKIFTTTTINYAKNITEAGYEHNYCFCKECFDDLRQGEKVILARMTTWLAGERTFILPEGIVSDFEYENIDEIKREIDFIFKPREAEDWISGVGAQTRLLHIEFFNLNFIIYDTDGNSVTVLQTINDVNSSFLIDTIEIFKKQLMAVMGHLKYFSLGSIYHVIPIKSKKIKNQIKQVDSGRVLSFYKSILKREKVKLDLVYQYALEALDKGLKQLAASEIRNYFNLELRRFVAGWEDFYIKKIMFSYLVILQAMQEMCILSEPAFKNYREGESRLMNEKLRQDECPDSIWEAENFLEEQCFNSEARALFYLGLIMKRVSIAQASKGHKNKPILKKVNFQGMSQKDILRFYEDLVEKLRQYNKVNFYTEWLMNRFHYYMGAALTQGKWNLNEHANVFYVMAGYAFQVGKKSSPDMSIEEQKAVEDENTNIVIGEENSNDNIED